MKKRNQSLNRISRYLSLILRHNPQAAGLELDEHGWADVDELIAGIKKKYKFSMTMLEEIVRTDEKQRYSFNEDKTLIRANQGHSIPVDVELKEEAPPEYLWHGTGEKSVNSIKREGLLPMSRLYVHLSKDAETARKVGQRHGKPHIFKIKTGQMHRDGIQFYQSANKIWLTKHVPPEYLIEE